ncbi:hypothetical protein L0F63_002698 [Massospora cicadina]|nr:hypothetical protein L0F63_002698 [Massospora cicadina]
MAEEASLNVSQDTKSEAELLAAQFDALDDEFSDGELSMLIDEPFVTPTVETSLKVEPMEPQFEPLQNSIPSASIGLVKKIKFSSKTRPSQGVPVTPAAAKREIYKINPGEVAADDFESLNRLYYMYLFPYKSFFHWLNYGTEGIIELLPFTMVTKTLMYGIMQRVRLAALA